jgi:transcriptional antiterminator NusG
MMTSEPKMMMTSEPKPDNAERQWYALWTHGHCELLVFEQLIAKEFDAFLPRVRKWSRRGKTQRLISEPMFSGYLFVRHAMDRPALIEILKTRGLVRILGDRWDRPAIVPDAEIDAIQRLLNTDLPVFPHAYLHEGQRVRITQGPLTDLTGILIQQKPNKGHLIVSVGLLRRSVAVELDCMSVEPIGSPVPFDATAASVPFSCAID